MKWVCGALVGVLIVVASAALMQRSLSGQDRGQRLFRVQPTPLVVANAASPLAQPNPPADDPAPVQGPISVGDALLRPLDLPFGEATSLADVQKFLAGALGAPVVLDLAALDRLNLAPEDTVQLDLKGVRLKTGLKLLLDQVGMTFRVVAEDNLLILTDATEAGEPIDRVFRQLKAIHDEMHDLRDAIADLRDLVEEDLGVEPEPDANSAVFVRAGTNRPARSRVRRPIPPLPRPTGMGTAG